MDNGAMRITNVMIPRRHLLMRYVEVTPAGVYSKKGDQKMLFGTMTYTRLKIAMGTGPNLAKACTTAVRYSAVRRQFAMQRTQFGEDVSVNGNGETSSKNTSGGTEDFETGGGAQLGSVRKDLARIFKPAKKTECQILDYSSQQYLIFPQLALAFAMHFAAVSADSQYQEQIKLFQQQNFDGLSEMHVLTSTLKAVSTVLMADGMEQCRKSLGGHGFLNAAGVGPQCLNALPQATYEGDFVVLSIQVGTAIFKACWRVLRKKGKDPNTPSLDYLYESDPRKPAPTPQAKELPALLKDHEFLISAIKRRAVFIHFTGAKNFQGAVARYGKANAEALDAVKIDMMKMTYAHAYVLYATMFHKILESTRGSALFQPISLLFEFFCLTVMDTSYEKGGGYGEFVASGSLPGSPTAYMAIQSRIKELLRALRPDAVCLVDAWNIPDYLLNSCLGRYDGRVYGALYEQTFYEPLNDTDVSDGYYKHIQYILHPEPKRQSSHQQQQQQRATTTSKL